MKWLVWFKDIIKNKIYLWKHISSDFMKVTKKSKIRNRYNKVPHLTRDSICERNINTRKHHTKESQEVRTFQLGDNKAAKETDKTVLVQ